MEIKKREDVFPALLWASVKTIAIFSFIILAIIGLGTIFGITLIP